MDIKVEIALSSTTLALENEDIISLYTSFRSTSKPSEPTYGAFASDGSIVIRDNNLDLFKRAQNGEFDKFNYPVTISLKNKETGNFEAISTQIINRRPTYNYADKTLSIQLSDKIDSMDNLVYEGYPYNLEAETAYDIILDLLTKFWDGTKALACLSANAYGTTTFASIFQDITIQYPYIAPQTTYRAAFSSVLSLAHCALICDENGNPRLIYLDKTTQQVEDTEVAVLTADKTQEAFTTSVILDNKFDNAQVQATNVSSALSTDIGNENVLCNNTIAEQGEVIENEKNIIQEYTIQGEQTGLYKVSSAKLCNLSQSTSYYLKKDSIGFILSQYTNDNLKQILAINDITTDNIIINCRDIITVYKSTDYATLQLGISSSSVTYPAENTYTTVKKTQERGENILIKDFNGRRIYYGGMFNEGIEYIRPLPQQTTIEYAGVTVETFNDIDTINENLILNYNNDGYNSTYTLTDFILRTGFHIKFFTATSNTETETDYVRNNGNLNTYLYDWERIPISVTFDLKGVVRTINLENIKAVGEGTKDNVAEVNTYGKLLQYGLNITEPNVANEIGHIKDYYENGLHTANMTVLGGVGYNSLGVETITETITEVTFEDVYYGNFTVIPSFTAQILLQNGQGNPNYTSTRTTALKDIIMSSNEHINFVYSTSSITYRQTVIDNNTQNKFIRFYGAYQYTAEQGSSIVSGNYSYIISFNFDTNRVTEDLTVSFTNVATSGYYYNLISYISGQIRLQMSNDFNFSWAGIGDKKIETETIITHDVPVPYDNDKQVFACGEYVTVKNYDNESPLYYRETEVPLQWQITENKITFDGGAVTQALTLKELKKQT